MNRSLQISAASLTTLCVGCALYLSHTDETRDAGIREATLRPHAVTSTPWANRAHEERVERTAGTNIVSQSTFQISAAHAISVREQTQPRHQANPQSHTKLTTTSGTVFPSPSKKGAQDPFTPPSETLRSDRSETHDARFGVAVAQPRTAWSFAGGPSGRELIVPIGSALPASLIDAGENASQAQVVAMDGIATDFIEALASVADAAPEPVTSSGRKPKPMNHRATWDAATRAADERYRMLFGVEAYNSRTAAAAKDALAEVTPQTRLAR